MFFIRLSCCDDVPLLALLALDRLLGEGRKKISAIGLHIAKYEVIGK